jgi:DNA-binding PadR family transcriptional regulator
MPQSHDKRRRVDLDLFILALIDTGVSTPYALQRDAAISQGASIPALQRLVAARSARQGESGPRGRTSYSVTALGKKRLETEWKSLIRQGPSGDLESDLRVALLAVLGGAGRLASRFLLVSADKRLEALASGPKTKARTELASLAHWYSTLRSIATRTVIEAESAAARDIAQVLPGKITASRLRRRANPSA